MLFIEGISSAVQEASDTMVHVNEWVQRTRDVLLSKLSSGDFLRFHGEWTENPPYVKQLSEIPYHPQRTDFAPPQDVAATISLTHRITMGDLCRATHIRQDDIVSALDKLGFLDSRTMSTPQLNESLSMTNRSTSQRRRDLAARSQGLGEWDGLELVIPLDIVLKGCEKWKVRGKGVLDETCCRV